MSEDQEIEPQDDRLAKHLRALGRPPMTVPQSVDDAILAAARARLARKRASERTAAWAAAATVVLAMGLAVLPPIARRQAAAPPATSALNMDVNGDGRVDILDALALARYVEAGAPYRAEWDLNRNGILDPGDAVVLASTVVKIGERRDVRFGRLDVFLDTEGRALAAYQLEINDESGRMRIVGVRGGTAGAFRDAPFYDSAALTRSRIVLAAFSTSNALPRGRVNVARLYVESSGGAPKPEATLIAAGTSDGQRIAASPLLVCEGQ
jgi:hypothetical protein